MKKKKLFFKITFLLFILASFTSNAQKNDISGNVKSTDGVPLPGVSVIVKGTTLGTMTDFDGNYVLNTNSSSATLIFSYIGMETKNVSLDGKTVINVVLNQSTETLEEVVVVGYGTQKKSDITGAVASVSKERLELVPNTNVAQALQGSIAGVVVTNNGSSASGGDISIAIRGRNSVAASTSPLVVLDGVPYSGSFSDINPVDIASMEVLKDASAAAIYGSRAANGVILITSKKGKNGKTRFTYDTYYGVLNATNIPDVLSASEFYDFKLLRDPNAFDQSELDIFNNGGGTDWIDLSLRTGTTLQHNLSASGGSDKFNYYISGTILDVEGITQNDDFQRSTLRVNLQANVNDWLKIGSNTQLSYTDQSGLGPSFSDAFYMNPLTNSHDENGELTVYPWIEDVFFGNPLQNTLADNSDKRYKVITNLYFDVDLGFIPGLSYRLNSGLEFTNTRQGTFWGANTKRGFENQGEAQVRNDFSTDVLLENIVSYKKDYGKHNLFLTGLYSYQDFIRDDQDLNSQGFPTEALGWRQANSAALVVPGTDYRKQTILSSMLRVNYGFDNRYNLTLTARRDGYSAFGINEKYAEFFSAGASWNIHNETFMQDSSISTLKLRATYGETGNQAVNAFDSLTLLNDRSYLDGTLQAPGFIPENELGNPNLSWETSRVYNLGLDYGLFKNRITGSVDVYRSNTFDLLADQSISPFHGATEIRTNIGELQNEGLELALSATAIKTQNFSWNINANIAFNRNEWIDIAGDGGKTDDVANDWFIGSPVDVVYELEYDGVWQLDDDIANSAQPDAEPGHAKAKDQITEDTDGDGIADAADGIIDRDTDRVIIGQQDPKTVAAIGMNFKYKNFSLYVLSQGAFGHIKQNGLKSDNVFGEVRRNTTLKNWWTPENPTNDFYANDEDANEVGISFYESADYWRIKDITFSYDLEQDVLNKLNMDKLRLYVTGRNLFTFTDFEGLDPEFTGTRDSPLQRTFTLGLTVSF